MHTDAHGRTMPSKLWLVVGAIAALALVLPIPLFFATRDPILLAIGVQVAVVTLLTGAVVWFVRRFSTKPTA